MQGLLGQPHGALDRMRLYIIDSYVLETAEGLHVGMYGLS